MVGQLMRTWRDYLRTPVQRSAEQLGDAIEEELGFHLAERASQFIQQGMSPDQARQAASARFGDTARVAAECHAAAIGPLAFWHRLHLVTTTVLAVAVPCLLYAAVHPMRGLISQLPTPIASMLDNDWTGDVVGRILDDQQQPIQNAHVLVVVKTWPDDSYFQRAYMTLSDHEGSFCIEDVHPINAHYEVQIAAVADHRTMQSTYRSQVGGPLQPVVFSLDRAPGFKLRVEADTGHTLAGIEVLPHERLGADGVTHCVYFDSAKPLLRRTDPEGRVELPYFQPGETATLMLRAPQGEWETQNVIVPSPGQVATLRTTLFPADTKES